MHALFISLCPKPMQHSSEMSVEQCYGSFSLYVTYDMVLILQKLFAFLSRRGGRGLVKARKYTLAFFFNFAELSCVIS